VGKVVQTLSQIPGSTTLQPGDLESSDIILLATNDRQDKAERKYATIKMHNMFASSDKIKTTAQICSKERAQNYNTATTQI